MSEQNRRAFLQLIRTAEGTAGSDGYRIMNGGERFTSFKNHPGRIGSGGTTTAAGAYQFTKGTWAGLQLTLKLSDFTPPNQDRAAIQKLKERGALPYIDSGDVITAFSKLAKEWVSLPGGSQPQKTIAESKNIFQSAGGQLA